MAVMGWILMGGAIGALANLVFARVDSGALAAPVLGVMGAIIGGVAGGTARFAAAGSVALVALFGVSFALSTLSFRPR
jgi:uncharacterized membrane protein YeaQ/YmgE (transglycosylase-associated protein family)